MLAPVFAILVSVAASVVLAVPAGQPVPHHSMTPPFVDDWWEEGVPHWDIGGDAVVTSKFVRLTPQKQSRFGFAWNSQHNGMASWEVRAHIKVRSAKNPGADGLGLWYVESPFKGPKPGPLFGMERHFRGIGVLLDSYDNDNRRDNPAVLFINNARGETNTWDDQQDFISTAQFRCQMDFRTVVGAGMAGHDTDGVIVTIQYHDRTLSVKLRHAARHEEVHCGEAKNLDLPQNWYWGVTATTGGVADNHDIAKFEVRPLGDSIDSKDAQPYEPGMGGEVGIEHLGHGHGRAATPSKPDTHFDHDHDVREKDYWMDKSGQDAPDAKKQEDAMIGGEERGPDEVKPLDPTE